MVILSYQLRNKLNSTMRLITGTLKPTPIPWLPSSLTLPHHPSVGKRQQTSLSRRFMTTATGQFTRIFMNILTNALRLVPHSGTTWNHVI